jgi:hypothetical protein
MATMCLAMLSAQRPATSAVEASRYVGSATCQSCHAAIYDRWKQTRMAGILALAAGRRQLRIPYGRVMNVVMLAICCHPEGAFFQTRVTRVGIAGVPSALFGQFRAVRMAIVPYGRT